MYSIKQNPEDFIVEEVADHELSESGEYALFCLEKRNLTSQEAIQSIEKALRTIKKSIGFAGNKDKRAITKQTISIRHGSKNNELSLPGINLSFIGYSHTSIRIGDLKGNRFTLNVISDTCPKAKDFMPNYFGEQRFSDNNALVGEAIFIGDFKRAAQTIQGMDFSLSAKEHLKDHPNDFMGCLRMLPKPVLLLYVHSFQSLLFNLALNNYIRSLTNDFSEHQIGGVDLAFPREMALANEAIQAKKIAIPGFGSKLNAFEEKLFRPIFEKYNLSQKSFVIRQLPWLSQEGSLREAVIKIENLKISQSAGETYRLEFFLSKGCYATVAVRSIFEG